MIKLFLFSRFMKCSHLKYFSDRVKHPFLSQYSKCTWWMINFHSKLHNTDSFEVWYLECKYLLHMIIFSKTFQICSLLQTQVNMLSLICFEIQVKLLLIGICILLMNKIKTSSLLQEYSSNNQIVRHYHSWQRCATGYFHP